MIYDKNIVYLCGDKCKGYVQLGSVLCDFVRLRLEKLSITNVIKY